MQMDCSKGFHEAMRVDRRVESSLPAKNQFSGNGTTRSPLRVGNASYDFITLIKSTGMVLCAKAIDADRRCSYRVSLKQVKLQKV
jgi:hypothetical protein